MGARHGWLVCLVVVGLAATALPAAAQPAEPYHNYWTLREDVEQLVEDHGDHARLRIVGSSVGGLDIFTVDVARNISERPEGEIEDLPALVVDGGHHGNEQLSIEAAYLLLEDVLEQAAEDPSTLDGKRLVVTPVINPDGYVRDKRSNTHRVDLNRNYPFHWGLYGTADHPASFTYRGPSAASEPETQANIDLIESVDARAYLSGHTGTYDLVLPWRASEDGEIPDWPMYEAYLSAVENETGLEYRDPSGAGESTAWAYGNRTALSIVVEVSEEQSMPATQGSVEARLEEPLGVYEVAWENLVHLQGHVHVREVGDGEVVVENDGWGPAYNVSVGDRTIQELPSGQTATLAVPTDAGELTFRRTNITGDDPALSLETVDLPAAIGGAAPAGGEQPIPGFGVGLAVVAVAAVAALRRR